MSAAITFASAVRKIHAGHLQAHRFRQAHAVAQRVVRGRIVLHASAARGRAEGSRMDADEHPRARFAVAMNRDGLAIPGRDEVFHRPESSYAAFGCSTTARTRGATNLAVRITPPVRVSSRTSTVVRELRTSTLRPARVASITYSRAEPLPASTRTSTKSPFAIHLRYSQFDRTHALSESGPAPAGGPQRRAAEGGRGLLPGL